MMYLIGALLLIGLGYFVGVHIGQKVAAELAATEAKLKATADALKADVKKL